MVAGAVSPPRLDLTNEDLIRAHIHAIWLAETGLKLGKTLTDILEVSGESASLALNSVSPSRPRSKKMSPRAALVAIGKRSVACVEWLQIRLDARDDSRAGSCG